MDYVVRFIVRDGSVGVRSLITYYYYYYYYIMFLQEKAMAHHSWTVISA